MSRDDMTAAVSDRNHLMKMTRARCLTIAYVSLCVCGFIFQVQDLARTYFAYKTRTTVDIAMPVQLVTPDMSLCVRYKDLYHGTKSVDSGLTIEEIFDGTPANTSLLSLCIYRHLNSYDAIIRNTSAKCNSEFMVDKFYNSEYICYRFQKVFQAHKEAAMQRFAYQNLANSPTYQGLFYGVFIDLEPFRKADLCKVVVHAQESWPNEAIATAPYFFRISDGVSKYNLVRAIYSTIEIIRMPDPYETHCVEYPNGGRKACENRCIYHETIDQFSMVPFTTIIFRPENITHIRKDFIARKNNSMALNLIENRCRKTCSREECNSLFFTTSILKEEKGDYDLFSVLVQVPITPRIKVSLSPASQLTDFLVFVTSCFGTWFGVSAMTFNPSHLLSKRRSKMDRPDQECRSCDECLQSMNRMFDEIRSIKKLTIKSR